MIHGGMGREERMKAQEAFKHDPQVYFSHVGGVIIDKANQRGGFVDFNINFFL